MSAQIHELFLIVSFALKLCRGWEGGSRDFRMILSPSETSLLLLCASEETDPPGSSSSRERTSTHSDEDEESCCGLSAFGKSLVFPGRGVAGDETEGLKWF